MPGKGEVWNEIQSFKRIKSLNDLTERLSSGDQASDTIIENWRELLSLAESHGITPYLTMDLSIVRGLAYYTGFVYEAFEKSGEGRALAGGGRYDHLLKKLSGNVDLPACGFAIGDMTLSDCLSSKRPYAKIYKCT